jgi:molecular chaperone GrpE
MIISGPRWPDIADSPGPAGPKIINAGDIMSADENRNEQPEEELNETAENATDSEEQVAGDEQVSELDALKGKVEEYQEQVLRVQAEMQNVRRRAEIDVEKAHKFALEKFVKELLPVADEGVEMTLSLFMKSLEKFNVEQIDPEGEPFDPQKHEAMSMVPAPGAEPNSVVSVVQKGYLLNGRVVRPAMVVVARAQDAPKVDEQA